MKKLLPWIAVLIALTFTGAPSALGQKEAVVLDDDERLVESAGLPSDGPGLLEFFRARSRTDIESGKLEDLVRRFAGQSVPDRVQAGGELVALGPLAIPSLRRVINDLEAPDVRERAQRCLSFAQGPASVNLASAAARVVAKRKPSGAADALLGYVPYADNDDVAKEISAALLAVALRDGKADSVLVRALSDPMPLRRAVAATVLSQAAPSEQRKAVEKLLHDPNGEVRMTAALSQAKANNAAAFPVLIELLAVLPINKRGQVEEVLQEWAGDWGPTGGPAGEDEIARRIRRDGWTAWWTNTNGPALLAMLDKRTLSPVEEKKVMTAIRRLGDSDYTTREKAAAELIARGRMILPILRESLKNNELEVVRRAQGCIQRIEEEPGNRLPTAALRLLGLRQPPGAAEGLLAFLPFAEEENVADAYAALTALAVRDGKPDPAVVRALTDAKPLIRAAAAEALARSAGPEVRPAIRKLLEDADRSVRLRAAMALASRDADTVPVLIAMMADLPNPEASQVHDFLSPLAGDNAPRPPDTSAASRKKASEDWAAWWKDNAAKADLTRLVINSQQTILQGFTVISEINSGRILEIDKNRKIRWSFNGTGSPVDSWVVANNRVVVAEHNVNRVTERDFKGAIIWTKQTNGNPHNVQRLPNGHTMIASNSHLIEVDRTGKEVFSLPNVQQLLNNFGQLTGGYKTKKGQYVCVTQNGRVVTFDANGKQLKFFDTNRGNAWCDLLANGHILLTQNGGNQVTEYDLDGKMHLELNVPSVTTAVGLPNGNMLVSSNQTNRVYEMDRRGKTLWEYQCQFPFRARGR